MTTRDAIIVDISSSSSSSSSSSQVDVVIVIVIVVVVSSASRGSTRRDNDRSERDRYRRRSSDVQCDDGQSSSKVDTRFRVSFGRSGFRRIARFTFSEVFSSVFFTVDEEKSFRNIESWKFSRRDNTRNIMRVNEDSHLIFPLDDR